MCLGVVLLVFCCHVALTTGHDARVRVLEGAFAWARQTCMPEWASARVKAGKVCLCAFGMPIAIRKQP